MSTEGQGTVQLIILLLSQPDWERPQHRNWQSIRRGTQGSIWPMRLSGNGPLALRRNLSTGPQLGVFTLTETETWAKTDSYAPLFKATTVSDTVVVHERRGPFIP